METKVPFFSIVNVFLPGLVFMGSCVLLFIDETKTAVDSIATLNSTGFEVLITASCFAIAYEAGYIIFRLGAIVIEPLLKKMFGWTEYGNVVEARKAGAEKSIDRLSREYAYTRTRITLFILLFLVTGVRACWIFSGICVLCVVVFVLTAGGHLSKIITTVEKYQTESN